MQYSNLVKVMPFGIEQNGNISGALCMIYVYDSSSVFEETKNVIRFLFSVISSHPMNLNVKI